MQETEKIWMNGELVDWADAKIHVASHGLHYGTGVFEGIRSYPTERGPAVFRLRDHLRRLETSAQLLYMRLPYSVDELRAACHETLAVNGLDESYLRPIAYYGYGELGVHTRGNDVEVAILTFPWGAYLGEEGQRNGCRAMISSWQRVGPNTIPHTAKATGIYLNSMLAVHEAQRAGTTRRSCSRTTATWPTALGERLHDQGRGYLHTRSVRLDPAGITRETIIEISRALGYTVHEKRLIRADLYTADEVFMCGTAVEVTPIRSIDDQEIGPPGPITCEIQQSYLDTVRGRKPQWADWLDYQTRTPAQA